MTAETQLDLLVPGLALPLTVWPWASYWSSLCLGPHVCEIGSSCARQPRLSQQNAVAWASETRDGCFLTAHGGCKSKVKVPARSLSGESSLSDSQVHGHLLTVSSHGSLMSPSNVSSYRGTDPIIHSLRTTLMTSSKPNDLSQGLPPNTLTFGGEGEGLTHANWGQWQAVQWHAPPCGAPPQIV